MSKLISVLHILRAYIYTKSMNGGLLYNILKFIGLINRKKQIDNYLDWLTSNSKYFEEYKGKKLREIPLMNKKIMMDNFNDINTKGLDKDKCLDLALKCEDSRDFSPVIDDITIGLSSGTSGSRGMFTSSKTEQDNWAGIILAKVLPNSILSKNNIALFLRANSNLYETLGSKKIKFKFFDLLTAVESHSSSLNEFYPSLIVSPPSVLIQLADLVYEKKITISPKKIVSAAEVLEPVDKDYIEKAFNQKVHQIYQCTEGFLAATCEYGTIHLNEDFVHFEKEWIDTERFIPIVTDLKRTTQPIVRYRLNDILQVSKTPCQCASPNLAISNIEGRADDIFYFENKEGKLTASFPDFIRRKIISSHPKIEEYKVVQNSLKDIKIQISPKEIDIEASITESINSYLNSLNINNVNISYEHYSTHKGSKKLKRIERAFNLEDNSVIK